MSKDHANGLMCRNGLHDWEYHKVWRSGQWRCLACIRATNLRYYREHAFDTERVVTPERRKAANLAANESGRRYPDHRRARQAVKRALQKGTLHRPDECASCHTACTPEASHDDYARQLDVEWLCRRCHAIKDRGLHVKAI